MSDDLVARLRHAWAERERQLAEDFELAQVADALTASPWTSRVTQDANGSNVCGRIVDGEGYAVVHVGDQTPERAVAEHIARHDPARVLAEVERGRRDIAAKRSILDRYEDALARQQDPEYSEIATDVQVEEYQDWIIPALAEAEGLA